MLIDELLERDKQREKDGFKRKIKMKKVVKPPNKFVMVPTTVEEKFYHDNRPQTQEERQDRQNTGQGEGEEGDVIGEVPIIEEEEQESKEDEEGNQGAGQGEGGDHEMEEEAYEIGRTITEQFELPNLKNKSKKKAIKKYKYDLTDKHRSFGQILDKKATIKKIIETNILLERGNLPDINNVDPTDFLISPHDKIYRVLSRERDYEAQAIVFFLRDYSGSMVGIPTDIVVGQHMLIYSWLKFQYEDKVKTRFILHDTEAKEVPNFYIYYNLKVAGGTMVASGFKKINEIIYAENLAKDYNIYVFYGTDGDDWDEKGEKTIPQIKTLLDSDISRLGIVVVRYSGNETGVEKYIKSSKLLTDYDKTFRMTYLLQDADEKTQMEAIKKIID